MPMDLRTAETSSERFGRLTFNKKVMAERLSRDVYERLLDVIENNEPMDVEFANEVAHAMKEWALSHGATHFCHWFQPLRGETAEKHDAFLSFDRDGSPIDRFSGSQLVQGEPDASSFPSGGTRTTFEARGYTAWDPTSPAFIMKSGRTSTLVVPSVFLSWTGEVLDRKTPLLRSLSVLEERAFKLLKLFGNRSAKHVRVTCGPEQEYFLVAKEFYRKRPDLILTGRTLFGSAAARDQQMEDHYFGSIKPRVLNFMADVESQLVERGIPAKTRHNEVAPHQFEIAPIFEEANLAVDHNLQVMEMMRKIADDHGLALLFHEKPFSGINGSGKHMNWSMQDSEGQNLLEPGATPKKNIQFLSFLAAILAGMQKYGFLLRTAVADAGNDHRLGANEAPPAIMSVYLGDYLSALLDEIEKGGKGLKSTAASIDHGLKRLPTIAKDNSDRNRTSPIAFTGNKFEFRAVGSSQSISDPELAMNLIVAHGLDLILAKIEKSSKKDIAEAAFDAVRDIVKDTKNVRFEGNGYGEAWHKEAAKRGLPNDRNTPAALARLLDKDVVKLYEGYKVLNQHELHAVYEIRMEAYVKTKEIELNLLRELATTYVLPALVRQIARYGEAKAAVTGGKAIRAKLAELDKLADHIDAAAEEVLKVKAKSATIADVAKRGAYLADAGVKALDKLRLACEAAELSVEHDFWTLPKYREMLFLM